MGAIARPKHARALFCNAQMGPKEIRTHCASELVRALLCAAVQNLGRVPSWCARDYERVLKVARMFADRGEGGMASSHAARRPPGAAA